MRIDVVAPGLILVLFSDNHVELSGYLWLLLAGAVALIISRYQMRFNKNHPCYIRDYLHMQAIDLQIGL